MPRTAVNDASVIERLLRTSGTWAVAGLSTDRSRDAFGIAALLQRLGNEIVPIHPRAEEVHGAIGYRSLGEVPAEARSTSSTASSTPEGSARWWMTRSPSAIASGSPRSGCSSK